MPDFVRTPCRSIKRSCADKSCGLRTEVFGDEMYAATIPGRFGGTERTAAFICPRCRSENIIPRVFIPNNLLNRMPSYAEFREMIEARIFHGTVLISHLRTLADAKPPKHGLIGRNWTTGRRALEKLRLDFAKVKAKMGTAKMFIVRNGALEPIFCDLAAINDNELPAYLDRIDCDLLILEGIGTDGRQWRTVFHPLAGMAPLVETAPLRRAG